MGLFNNFLPGASTPQQGQSPAPAVDQQGQPGQPGQGGTPPAQDPAAPAPAADVTLADLLQPQPTPGADPANPANPADPSEQNRAIVDALLREMNPAPEAGLASGVPELRSEPLGEYLGTDPMAQQLSAGMDFPALIEALNGEDAPKALQDAFLQMQRNTITTFAPMINHLVAQATEAAISGSIANVNQQQASDMAVSTLNNTYGQAPNSAMQELAQSLTRTLAQKAPNVGPQQVAEIVAQILAMTPKQTQQQGVVQQQAGNVLPALFKDN